MWFILGRQMQRLICAKLKNTSNSPKSFPNLPNVTEKANNLEHRNGKNHCVKFPKKKQKGKETANSFAYKIKYASEYL